MAMIVRMKTMSYRADIDGIRAIAVLCVVLFHLDVYHFSGGYVGVDVFYVISGYLVSGQILSRLQNGTFRFGEFYSSRVRRLFPALFVTIVATFVASALLLLPGDFERFSRSALAAVASVSNISFYAEAGYWDFSGRLKPLLHTWSLGVEEQFYIVWPAVLVALSAIAKPKGTTIALFGIMIFGLVLSEWMCRLDPAASFYLFPFRVFEFSAGAITYRLVTSNAATQRVLSYNWSRWACLVFGGSAILLCSLYYSGDISFPGIWALPPTLATVALLLSGTGTKAPGFLGNAIISSAPLVWLGKISYSLYLVHWPIISLYKYTHGHHGALKAIEQIFLFVATMVAAVVLHYGVETKFYKRSGVGGAENYTPARTLNGLGIAALAIAFASYSAWNSGGWPWRFPDLELTEADIVQAAEDRYKDSTSSCNAVSYWTADTCHRDADIQVLVFGNSIEVDAYNFLNAGFGGDADTNIIQFGDFRECVGGLSIQAGRWTSPASGCQEKIDSTLNTKFAKRVTHLVFASPYAFDRQSKPYLDIVSSLKQLNPQIQLIVFGPFMILRRECSYFFSKTNSAAPCVANANVVRFGFGSDPANIALRDAFTRIGFKMIDRVDLLCKGLEPKTCEYATPDGHPVFYDTRHFSYEFAAWAGKKYAQLNPEFFRQDIR